MNLIEFNEILKQPGGLTKDQINGLQAVLEEYPYFQAAHFLQLNGLRQQHSFKYNNYLKMTAAYTTDRSVLFDYITAGSLDVHAAPANLTVDTPKAVEKQAETSGPVKPEELPEELPEETSPEESLKVGHPLQFKRDETYSFREWLNLSGAIPIDRGGSTSQDPDPGRPATEKEDHSSPSKTDLIDKFIAASPKINPSLYENYTDIAMDSVQENESLMTETLAHVYVEQKKYDKAIMAFTILSLKYPEKSSFFAHQIKAIKKLQEK